MQIVAVVGNPKPGSRTSMVAGELATRCQAGVGGEVVSIELAELAGGVFSSTDGAVAAARQQVADAALAIFASPTFKGAYSGLLKAFVDYYPERGLAGVTAVPLMMGGNDRHSLAPDVALRPLLTELGASCPTRSLFVTDAMLEDLGATLDAWCATELAILTRALGR
jgi:FMN reductase